MSIQTERDRRVANFNARTRERLAQAQAPKGTRRTRKMVPTGIYHGAGGWLTGYRYVDPDEMAAEDEDVEGLMAPLVRQFGSAMGLNPDSPLGRRVNGDEEEINRNRIERYFPNLATDMLSSEEAANPASIDQFYQGQIGYDRDPTTGSEYLTEILVGAGRGVEGGLDLAIEWSLTDPDAFISLQMQLLQHGFMSEPDDLGRWSDRTADAIAAMIKGKVQVGEDESVREYLDNSRIHFQNNRFSDMLQVFAERDKAAADDLEKLRDRIAENQIDLQLTSSDGLRSAIQATAAEQLGRRLSTSEEQRLVDAAHEEERKEFYNSAEYRRYQALLDQMSRAVTEATQQHADPLSSMMSEFEGIENFMGAIMTQESGGDPNVVNRHSQAFGLFQFLPSTWKSSAEAAGLDPTDRSAENQVKVARFQMAAYYSMFGNWRDVAIAWYAGENSPAIGNPAVGRGRNGPNGEYPSIQSYADKIMERMRNGGQLDVDKTYAAADAGSLGGAAAGAPDQVDIDQWWTEMKSKELAITPDGKPFQVARKEANDELGAVLGQVSDIPSGGINEYERFDPAAFLEMEVRRSGGVDADTWEYVQQATNFFDLLEAR